MKTTSSRRRVIAAAVMSAGVALAGLGSSAGMAQADPEPGPNDAHHWCPGQEPVRTGNARTDPLNWDWNICHTYWYVLPGQGNVSSMIWDGDNPPAPPPSGPFWTPPVPPGWCMGLFVPSPCPQS